MPHLLVLMVATLGTSSYLCRRLDMGGTKEGREETGRDFHILIQSPGLDFESRLQKVLYVFCTFAFDSEAHGVSNCQKHICAEQKLFLIRKGSVT